MPLLFRSLQPFTVEGSRQEFLLLLLMKPLIQLLSSCRMHAQNVSGRGDVSELESSLQLAGNYACLRQELELISTCTLWTRQGCHAFARHIVLYRKMHMQNECDDV